MNKNEIKEAFKLYDTNNDGFISLEEYIMGCRSHSNIASDESLIRAFKIFDENKDGKINESEFLAAMSYLGLNKHFIEVDLLEIRDAFRLFDTNFDGKITLDEYIEGCRRQGNKADETKLIKAFRLFDIDKDNNVDENEFYWAMQYLAAIEM